MFDRVLATPKLLASVVLEAQLAPDMVDGAVSFGLDIIPCTSSTRAPLFAMRLGVAGCTGGDQRYIP